ncbi:hypothetical protein C8A05DRAFT_34490 [Staphylotrichum tortipilum]|uniref:Zn(2)-C6 fungal-type domain-containing protein n=1 Tax=Staphylotrichum tortipilum TaxID=2831512 RepID=A0AAN6MJR7_9PEZI|nr:hypothetical protein C8A05DRAFT_34490 [Staphylotrichum longicolle]
MPRPPHPPSNLDIASAAAAAAAASTSTASPLHRLPVNPRRKKVSPDERKRVATACNSCNVRRIKCSGDRPCRQCTSAQRACLYPEPVERVTIPRAELESLQRRCASLERQLAVAEPGHRRPDPRPQQLVSPSASVSASASASTSASASVRADPSEAPSPNGNAHVAPPPGGIDGRMLADSDGISRYLGETSGATFLDTLKVLITTATPLARVLEAGSGEKTPAGAAFLWSVGQYQTHDSRPMALPPAVDPLALPPEPDMAAALAQVRYFVQDGTGQFPSGGIMYWPFDDVHKYISLASAPGAQGPDGVTRPGPKHRPLALCQAAFALAHVLNLREPGSSVDGKLGEDHFARARVLLGDVLDRTTYSISDIAALALMAVYWLENNRRDAAYMAISNAMTISVMHGLHKGASGNETDVRTFWTVYVLDRWLGCVMGRPPTTPDDAITLPMPRECFGLPSPMGLQAHIELSRISDYLVYSSYRESGLPDLLTNATVRVGKTLERLRKWRENLPQALQLPADPLILIPVDLFTQASSFGHGPDALLSGASVFGQDRACWSLHMSYNQLIILAVRPAMLTAVWKAVGSILSDNRPFGIENNPQIEPIRACSDAARRNLRLGRLMRLPTPRQKLLLPDLHYIFNAAIILMMHQMLFVNLRTQDLDDVVWAGEVFEMEAETGSEYGKDCAGVLRDLRYLAQQLRNPIHDPDTKQILLSGDSVLRGLLPDGVDRMDESSDDVAAVPDGGASGRQGKRDMPYRQEVLNEALAVWWKEDHMKFYNTFLSSINRD